MSMSNCPRCGRLFSQTKLPICSSCEKEEENDFKKVKEYIEENPGSIMGEISTETGVAVKRIQKFLRDGRLEVTKGLQGSLNCQGCGVTISSGKYCNNCTSKIEHQVQGVVMAKKMQSSTPTRSSGSGMHINKGSDR